MAVVAVLTAVATKAVVAIVVELSPAVTVGAFGVPVNIGEAIFAFRSNADCVAVVVAKLLKS